MFHDTDQIIPERTIHRQQSAGPLNWNSALDLWLASELIALSLMMLMAADFIMPAAKSPPPALRFICLGWVASFALISWYRRSVQSFAVRCDRIRTRLADWVRASLLLLVGAFMATDLQGISRTGAAATFVGGLVLIAACGWVARIVLAKFARKGLVGERVAIYGCNGDTGALIRAIEAERGPAARIEALFDERHTRGDDNIEGHAVNRSFSALIDEIKRKKINTVVIDLPWSATTRIADLVQRLEEVSVDVLMAPAPVEIAGTRRAIGYVGSLPTLSLCKRRIVGLQAIGKVALDRTFAALGLLFLSPFLLIVAVAIKLDSPGPVLFRQKRRGMNNEPFDMLKFRSMHHSSQDANANRLVIKGDNRVTRLGALLRRTSIDELPQLANVLFGQMSLVGPRPHAYSAKAADRLYEEVVSRYPARHRVRPGITGLAQVRGYRGNTAREEDIINRVESDLEYIDRWTLGLDLLILSRTAATFLFQRGAY